MAAPQNVSLPPFFVLEAGMQVVVTAVDATTGAVVSGVKVSGVSIDVDDVGEGPVAPVVPLVPGELPAVIEA